MPATDGTSATVQQGSLLVLNRFGKQIANLKNPNLLDGPWGMAVNDNGDTAQIHVSNVLNGTITRLNVSINNGLPDITSAKQIATGYTTQTSDTELVLGPTGLAYNAQVNLLNVASTAENAIYAIPNASSLNGPVNEGIAVVQNNANLQGPIGLTFAPNGDLLVTNGDAVNTDPNNPRLLLEFRPRRIRQCDVARPGRRGGIRSCRQEGRPELLAGNRQRRHQYARHPRGVDEKPGGDLYQSHLSIAPVSALVAILA